MVVQFSALRGVAAVLLGACASAAATGALVRPYQHGCVSAGLVHRGKYLVLKCIAQRKMSAGALHTACVAMRASEARKVERGAHLMQRCVNPPCNPFRA